MGECPNIEIVLWFAWFIHERNIFIFFLHLFEAEISLVGHYFMVGPGLRNWRSSVIL